MFRKEKNPRSKLGKMKMKYVFTSMGIFLGIFLLAYLLASIVFMVLETGVYTNLIVMVVILVGDVFLTNYIVNTKLAGTFLREELHVKPNAFEKRKQSLDQIVNREIDS